MAYLSPEQSHEISKTKAQATPLAVPEGPGRTAASLWHPLAQARNVELAQLSLQPPQALQATLVLKVVSWTSRLQQEES